MKALPYIIGFTLLVAAVILYHFVSYPAIEQTEFERLFSQRNVIDNHHEVFKNGISIGLSLAAFAIIAVYVFIDLARKDFPEKKSHKARSGLRE